MLLLIETIRHYWIDSGGPEYYREIRFNHTGEAIEMLENDEVIGGVKQNSGGRHFVEIWCNSTDLQKRQELVVFLLRTLSALLHNTTLIIGDRTY